MDNKGFESDNTPAELNKSWHIPRPTLARSSKSSQGSTSSNNSTQSARSGSLLLTAANLAQIQNENADKNTRQQNIQYYLEQTNNKDHIALPVNDLKKPDPDAVSVASSMHFTVVNMNTKPVVRQRSFCRKHQLTILVLTMSALFTIGIMAAIFLLEMRAKRQRY
ncbi:uncharacterized protein LOC123012962 [Tribolium madens]|uniref:uncharacterized protein LOC123012962 n=1 Tax=Tribolium madens TaxID=41895 RepID=UPI001CF73F63|nr:uncharacterized protein LOC123012962 [Tribolium madens]